MFIEKLTAKDVLAFARSLKCGVVETKKLDDCIYLKISSGSDTYPEFWMNDFDCWTTKEYKFYESRIKELYIDFMKKTFENEGYREQYKAHINPQSSTMPTFNKPKSYFKEFNIK